MKAFKYSPSNPYIQDIVLEPGTYTFGASIFTNGYDNAIGLQTELGAWISIPLEIKAAAGWNSVVKTFTITQKCTKIDLMYSGTKTNLHILNPWLKKGANVTPPRTNEADLLESVGEGSYTVLLSNGNHTFAGTETTALAGSTSTQILVYSGIERVFPTSITVNTSDLPVGMTRSISLETSRVTFNVTTAMTSPSGTIPITFMVNGRSMTALFSYSISFKGGKGEGAAIIRLTGDTQFISVSKEGAVVPPSNFTVVGTAENTSISSWRYAVDSYSPSTTLPTGVSRSGNTVTINPNTSTFKLLTIIASDGTVSDSFSIARVTDGGDGKDGEDGKDGKDGEDGKDGDDGDGNVHIYRHSLLKPSTPASGVANPPGWTKNPDKGVSTPIPTNWTLKDKWYQSEELTTSGTTSISVINFTTTLPNQVVVLELWADGHATYDYIYAGNLNIGVTTFSYYDRVIGGKKIISYDVPNAGSHSIQIMWRKGIATIAGSNRGYFAIIKDVKVWRSTTAVINKIYQSWSSPEEFYPDSSTEETIYCLSKTETPPLISDSAAYIDEYLPLPCALTSYRGDFSTSRTYAIAQVVVYSGEYYKIIKAVPSNYTGNPTNTEYFENIKGWTDNAKGATKAFPFEYRSKRKKSGGAWGAFSASTVDGRWVENGKPGEDGDGITSTDIHYAKSQNGVTPPTIAADWGTSLPTPVKGWYLWTRTTHNYRKSAPITSYSVSYWAEDGDDGKDGKDGKDGDDGDDGKNIYLRASTQLIQFNSAGTPTPSGTVSVVGTAVNTTITTWLYSVNGGTFGSALPAGVSRSGNTVNISPSTITFRTLTIHASDGTIVTTISIAALYDGSNGLPGKMPIQIEWTTGDLHLNNETVVHYIYYRAGNTWWRLKDTYTSRTATSTPSTTYYQQLSSVESFVTKILIAEQANLGGLIFKDNKLISQKGMINGVEATDFANPLFKPYVYIDGSNGEIKANKLLNPFVLSDVDISGDLQSKLTNNHNVYLDASGSGGSDWVYHTLPGSGTLADKELDGLNLKIYAPNGSNKRIRISPAHANGLIFTENPETTTTKIEIVPGARERIHLSAVWDRLSETLDWVITFRSSYMVKAQTTNTTEARVPNVFKPNDIIFKGEVSSSGVVSNLVSFYNNSMALAVSVTSNVFRISIPFQAYVTTLGRLVARNMRDDQFGIEIYPWTGQSSMYSYSLNRYRGTVGSIDGVHFYIQFRNQTNGVASTAFQFVVKALDYIFNNPNLSDTL